MSSFHSGKDSKGCKVCTDINSLMQNTMFSKKENRCPNNPKVSYATFMLIESEI